MPTRTKLLTVREAAACPHRWIGVGRIVMLGVAAISLYLVAPSVLAVFERPSVATLAGSVSSARACVPRSG